MRPGSDDAASVERFAVECLCCGQRRIVAPRNPTVMQVGECPRCGYLGWAPSAVMSERARGAVRARPPAERRLRAV
jgi:hypothetical protein